MASQLPAHLPAYRRQELAVVVLLTVLCLALPTRNPSGDAWYYAACARWGHELAQPHHLLYNYAGWWWLQLWGATGAAPAGLAALPWLQALNSLALGGCLLALAPLLHRAGARPTAVPAWLLLVGSSFGMLRFAVENEAYIQPLLLALLASLAWARAIAALPLLVGAAESAAGFRAAEQPEFFSPTTQFQSASREHRTVGYLLLAGSLAALACLLHQMLVWWWLGLLLGLQPWRPGAARRWALTYAAPAALVPLAYWLAAPPGGGLPGLLRFALHDYLTGGARVELSWRSLFLTPIGLVRTLGQVHGNLLLLWQRWPLPLSLVALGCLALGVYGGLALRAAHHRAVELPTGTAEVAQLPALTTSRPPAAARRIQRTHLLIFGLQLAFAAQAAGNAEFMVMLPALAAAAGAGSWLRRWPGRGVAALGAALLAWNLAFGLLPAHALSYATAGPALRARVQQQPGAWFLLLDPNLLRNQLHYYTGQAVAPPRVLGLVEPAAPGFRRWLQQRLTAGDTVYTDALGGPRPLDRARLTQGDPAATLLAGLPARRVLVLPTFFGPGYLSRLALPAGFGAQRAAQPKASASATVNTGAAR